MAGIPSYLQYSAAHQQREALRAPSPITSALAVQVAVAVKTTVDGEEERRAGPELMNETAFQDHHQLMDRLGRNGESEQTLKHMLGLK